MNQKVAVERQIWNQVWNQPRLQALKQFEHQISIECWNQASDQVWNLVSRPVWDQVQSQVCGQVRLSIWNQAIWDQAAEAIRGSKSSG